MREMEVWSVLQFSSPGSPRGCCIGLLFEALVIFTDLREIAVSFEPTLVTRSLRCRARRASSYFGFSAYPLSYSAVTSVFLCGLWQLGWTSSTAWSPVSFGPATFSGSSSLS